MGEVTNIAWTNHSWSPWIGCTEVSPGCLNCYAKALDHRHKYGGAAHWGPGVPRYRTKSWHLPLAWNKKAAASGQRWTVFPSLCDPFDNEVPDEWRRDLWDLIELTPRLTWLLLTKRIGNAMQMLRTHDWAAGQGHHVWLGASIVNQEEADRDIPKLLATPAAKRFVSYEPALGPVDWTPWLEDGHPTQHDIGHPVLGLHYLRYGTPQLDWIIVGGESSQGSGKARPFNIEWARSTIAQCKAAGVPVFVKQIGSHVHGNGSNWWHTPRHEDTGCGYFRVYPKDRAGADPAEWPEDIRVQEFPA